MGDYHQATYGTIKATHGTINQGGPASL